MVVLAVALGTLLRQVKKKEASRGAERRKVNGAGGSEGQDVKGLGSRRSREGGGTEGGEDG